MKQKCILIVAAICLASIAHAEPVRIGVITDLSGPMASWGKQSALGAEIARDEIRAAGGEVEVIFGDHQLQAKSAVSEFQKLSDLDHIDAVYSEFTPTTIAVAPIAASKKVPMIYAAAAESPLAVSPNIFKSYMNYVDGCRTIAEMWRTKGVKTVGILKSNLEFGELCLQGLKTIYPNPIEAVYNPNDDVTPQIISFKSKGIEAIMNATFESDFLKMLQSIKKVNWTPYLGTQSDAVANEAINQFSDLLKQTTVFALPALPDEFVSRVKVKDPGNTLVSISAAGLAYLHVKQLYEAAHTCKKGDSDCAIQHLTDSKSDLTTGFSRWTHRIADFRMSLLTWKDGVSIDQTSSSDGIGKQRLS